MNTFEKRRLHGEGGFTLIELMIGLLISTILVYFLFSIQSKMTRSFRSQNTAADVTASLSATRNHLANEIRMAGFAIPGGVVGMSRHFTQTVSAGGTPPASTVSAITFNEASDVVGGDPGTSWGLDEIRIIYGNPEDSGRQLSEMQLGGGASGNLYKSHVKIVPVADDDDPTGPPLPHDFVARQGTTRGSLLLLASRSNACVVETTTIDVGASGDDVLNFDDLNNTPPGSFNTSSPTPYNYYTNDHCDEVAVDFAAGKPVTVMKAVTRKYRINVALQPGQGVFQVSDKFDYQVDTDWTDLAYGLTNMQFAVKYENPNAAPAPTATWASDTDLMLNWWETLPGQTPTMVSVGLEAKSPFGSRGTVSLATPAFGLDGVEGDVGNAGQACPTITNTIHVE